MLRLTRILLLQILLFGTLFANYFDSGFITWQQPNGITFTARLWGDEFQNWMESDDGYRIIRGVNNFFYFAVLDSIGEFSPSNSKVGIDPSLPESYKLERSQERIAEIHARINAFSLELQEKKLALQSGVPLVPTTGIFNLAVVLIDFADSLNLNYNKFE